MSTILIFGVFDLFHLGHLRLFKQAKKYGNKLIVAVQNSHYVTKFKPNAKVFYSTNEKLEILSSIKEIDELVVYNEITPEYISNINFDILGLGEDHIGDRFNKLVEWCNNNNKKVVRLKRTANISSSELKSYFE